ncbi:MAG: hypothetical protein N3A65_06645 [candidate division WOR-3 bacterium]|nr:hypothetical protein [candidate division WOR-3 bacterium]
MGIYYVFDKISPELRNLLTIFSFFAGFALQLNSRNILVGLPFIIFCAVINFVRNFSIKPVRAQKFEWKEVTPERLEQVLRHCIRIKKITGGKWGCVILLIIWLLMFVWISLMDMFLNSGGSYFPITALIIDSIIVFSGLILSGQSNIWIPNDLDVKIPIVKRILSHPVFSKDPSLKMIPYLEFGKTKEGVFPNDTRILIKFKDAPDDFIGLQFQISINNVHDRKYPYCYCVIIAKKSFRLMKKYLSSDSSVAYDSKITVERETSNKVDVIIIRQTTTKYTGYHTDESVQDYILATGIDVVKKIIRLTSFS